MSWLSSGLKKLKPLGKVVNKITDVGSQIVGYVPGVGPIAAGAIDAAGDLAGGKNLKSALWSGLKTGGSAYLGGKLAGAVAGRVGGAVAGKAGLSIPGISKVASAGMPMVGPGGISIPTNLGAANDASRGLGAGILGGLKKVGGQVVGSLAQGQQKQGGGGILGSIGDIIGGGINKLGGVDGVLGGGALAMGAVQAKKAGDMRERALKMVEQDYASRAPLRAMGLQGMLNEQRPDLSSTFAPASQNPFGMRRVS